MVVIPSSRAQGWSNPRKVPANSPRSSIGMPQAMFPIATPIRKLDNTLPPKNPTSHICRHQRIGCLLRNSIANARKMSAASSSMNTR